MGIEFRLGRNDHKVTEDLLSAQPRSVDGIWVDAQNLVRQAGVIEVARSTGKRIFCELQVDRLEYPGFDFGPLPYLPVGGVSALLAPSSDLQRRELVERTIEFQSAAGLDLVAPHVFCTDPRHQELVVDLADRTISSAGGEPVRVIIASNRSTMAAGGLAQARHLADALGGIGVSEVELRLSPVGDADMSAATVASALEIVEVFADHVGTVVLGWQGRLGPAALALGNASAFSVGVGMREHYSIPGLTSPQEPNDDDQRFGPQAGVRLPGVGATVTRKVATALYQDPAIRSRIRCRYQCCSGDIEGPAKDPRKHYLHSRAAEAGELLDRPLVWRASLEQERLRRGIELADIINDGHIPPKAYPIKTRTMRSLVDLLEDRHQTTGVATS